MGGSSLQFLRTLILLLLCMKPATGNNLGLADTHLVCKEHERQALLKIKYDLIDDYGHLSSWNSNQDCCKWSGVRRSNQTGHVIMLNLNASSIPLRHLQVLQWLFKSNTSVVELDFSFNQFQGLISNAFSRINSLAHLYLSSNEFEGEIPKAFGGMCNLKTLNLSRNYLSGQLLDFILNLTECGNHSLEVLNLKRNQILGSLLDPTTFPSLRVLSLSQNHLNGAIPVSLGKLSNLEGLYLRHNSLEGVISKAHFSKLTKLKKIPTSPQLDTFNASSYEGNAPLPKKCLGEEIAQNPTMNRSREHAGMQDEREGFISIGFYVSVALGFIAGFWGVVGTLVLNMSLRVAYFRFLNDFKDRLYVAISVNMARVQRQLQN
ncbi:receptor-like protein EIX2 [Quercus robur]|uniref:receptor-like protein EIX2 n=1 Tax=Quercus robur TaxID=38942 RepID=UPI0021610D31|nr:receptor-like protein EIX2 [Quercus robur]